MGHNKEFKSNEKTKFTLELSGRLTKLLDQLAEDAGTSRVEVFRRALAFYSYVDEEVFKKKDRRLSIVNIEDQIVKDIVLAP